MRRRGGSRRHGRGDRSGSTDKERRRQRRYSVDGIFGTLVPSTHVSLLNLSRTGIAVRLPFRLPPGERYLFEFQHSGSTARMEVEVAWCTRERSGGGLFDWWLGGRYVAGGRITDIYRDTRGGLWAGIRPEGQAG